MCTTVSVKSVGEKLVVGVGRRMHECEGNGTLGYWYSGRPMHECEGTGTLGYWYSLSSLTYFEVDLVDGAPGGTPILEELPFSHF